jgi:hypothetical protein
VKLWRFTIVDIKVGVPRLRMPREPSFGEAGVEQRRYDTTLTT